MEMAKARPGLRYNIRKFVTEYEELRHFYYNLLPAREVCHEFVRKHGGYAHAGYDKWIEVGLAKRKWFKEWRLTVRLNPFFINNTNEDYGKVYFELATSWFLDYPDFFMNFIRYRGGSVTHKRYTLEEVQDEELLRKDIGALVEEALVKGTAWEF
jgi:hypothetical protein